MKVAIYSPYLDTFGGGERYMMTIAEVLSASDTVDVLIDEHLSSLGCNYLKEELSKRFNLNLQKVNFFNAPFGKNTSSFSRMLFLKKYSLLFYLTDGSIFYPSAKKNILHIQSPLVGQPTKSIWGKIKLKGWDLIIYNSEFTRRESENNWQIRSRVIYPPVDTEKIKPLKKKKYILSVGRFFGYLKDKKHEVLINVFKKLCEGKGINNWSLYLAGSAGTGDQIYLQQLQNLAKGLPINICPNLSYDKLIKLYGESSIYWHAAGFRENDPTKMEHFGIATVEAMAAGCVPVVIRKGGQTEIVENGKSGFLWENLSELQEFTVRLIADQSLMQQISKEAQDQVKKFSKNNFTQNIMEVIKE